MHQDDIKMALIFSFTVMETLKGSIHQMAGLLGVLCPFCQLLPALTALGVADKVSIKYFCAEKVFDMQGNGHVDESLRVKCQIMACFLGWAGAIHLCLLQKLARSRAGLQMWLGGQLGLSRKPRTALGLWGARLC